MPLTELRNRSDLRAALVSARAIGQRIALVPTMGNLHAGHLSLVEVAQQQADIVIVSIFVNPTQFGPNEDYAAYPRTLDDDLSRLTSANCDWVFLPGRDEMYPHGTDRAINVTAPAKLTDCFCGASRPGHFNGMLTIVARLLNLVLPDVAVFGEKDYQQLQLIRYLCEDFGYATEIIGAPIIREASGLAMSSRNGYLDEQQQLNAAGLYSSLTFLQHKISNLRSDHWSQIGKLLEQTIQIQHSHGLQNEYLEVVNAATLHTATATDSTLRILTAAQIGHTRLIDNIAVDRLL